MTPSAAELNAAIWQRLYAAGGNDLRYPSDVLVRLGAALLDRSVDRRILDFGCGTGANLVHFASQGYQVWGVDSSRDALVKAEEKLNKAHTCAQLRLTAAAGPLPFEDGFFDVAYAWHVLYYNDAAGWGAVVRELQRVSRQGALVMIATAAPGDVSQLLAEPIGASLYRSRVPGQEGCVVLIPEREGLEQLFPGQRIEVGEFGYRFGSVAARYWLITYRVR